MIPFRHDIGYVQRRRRPAQFFAVAEGALSLYSVDETRPGIVKRQKLNEYALDASPAGARSAAAWEVFEVEGPRQVWQAGTGGPFDLHTKNRSLSTQSLNNFSLPPGNPMRTTVSDFRVKFSAIRRFAPPPATQSQRVLHDHVRPIARKLKIKHFRARARRSPE